MKKIIKAILLLAVSLSLVGLDAINTRQAISGHSDRRQDQSQGQSQDAPPDAPPPALTIDPPPAPTVDPMPADSQFPTPPEPNDNTATEPPSDSVAEIRPAATDPILPPPPEPSKETDWAANGGDLNLTISANDLGPLLSWRSVQVNGFRSYRIVRSETNPQPSWPADGYLVGINDIGFTKYIDQSAEPGQAYHYRVCANWLNGSVTCGNTVTWNDQ